MNWEGWGIIATVAGFASILLFGPSWQRRWLLTCFAAIAGTVLIALAIAFLTIEDVDVDGATAVDAPPLVGWSEWVAVYHLDDPPEPEREAFMAAAGFDVFQSPASCWTGLPATLGVPPDRPVLGVWGPTEDKLRAAMDRVGGEPLLAGEFRNICPGD